jgi:hypothetical protein
MPLSDGKILLSVRTQRKFQWGQRAARKITFDRKDNCCVWLTLHVFLQGFLLDAKTALGVNCETGNRQCQGHFFVAGNGACAHQKEGMALRIQYGTTVGLTLASEAAKGCQTRGARLEAAFQV